MSFGSSPAVQEQLRRLSSRTLKTLSRRYGNELGIWYGSGFPKSGTVWLCELLSYYLYLPYPQNYLTPSLMKSVIHSHWEHDPRRDRCVYVVRDGRDVMTSYYFHWLNQLHSGRAPAYANERLKLMQARLPAGINYDDPKQALSYFIEMEVASPRGVRLTWNDHVLQWLRGGDNVAFLTFEDMLTDGAAALAPAIEKFDGPVDMERLEIVFDLLSFARRTGRERGTSDQTAFRRKGAAGDWMNHFDARSVEVFKQHGQDALVAAGYVDSDSWTVQESEGP